jgi:GR25 family glycosyltransferase involved in LPS biosynthesis
MLKKIRSRMHVLIISLTVDRFEKCKQRFDGTGVTCEWVKGVIANETDRQCAKAMCTNGMIGIFKAHQKCWQIASCHQNCIITEDDVYLTENFVDFLPKIPHLLQSSDFVALGNMISAKSLQTVTAIEQLIYFSQCGKFRISNEHLYSVNCLIGAHAYAISTNTAHVLMASLSTITGHVDRAMTKLIHRKKITGIGIRPSVLYQGDFTSSNHSISAGSSEVDAPPLDWLIFMKQLRVKNKEFSISQLIIIIIGFILLFVIILFQAKKKRLFLIKY